MFRGLRVRSPLLLDGKSVMSVSQAVSHRDCDLGKWLYAEGAMAFGHLPAMQELLPVHEELHTVIKHVIELKEQRDNDGAEAAFSPIGPLSHQIIDFLYRLERDSAGTRALPATRGP
jgi:hypothetical protein